MQQLPGAFWFFAPLAVVCMVAAVAILIRVKEKLPRIVVSIALFILAIGLGFVAWFMYRSKDWGVV